LFKLAGIAADALMAVYQAAGAKMMRMVNDEKEG